MTLVIILMDFEIPEGHWTALRQYEFDPTEERYKSEEFVSARIKKLYSDVGDHVEALVALMDPDKKLSQEMRTVLGIESSCAESIARNLTNACDQTYVFGLRIQERRMMCCNSHKHTDKTKYLWTLR